MQDELTIVINEDGGVLMIDGEAARIISEDLGIATISRASHVLPCSTTLRWLFIILRWLFGDEKRVAQWTRTWRCLWFVDATPAGLGVLTGVWRDREEAIAAEVNALNKYFAQ